MAAVVLSLEVAAEFGEFDFQARVWAMWAKTTNPLRAR
jgi:hypothetical protein